MKRVQNTSDYTDDEIRRLLSFAREACGGRLNDEQAQQLARELGKEHLSVVAEALNLGIVYLARGDDDLYDERENWENAIHEFETEWHQQGLGEWWSFNYGEFLHRLRSAQDSIPNAFLFTEAEIAQRRCDLVESLDERLLAELNAGLRDTIWRRLFERRRADIEELEQRYWKLGRAKLFDRICRRHRRRVEEVRRRPVSGLFNQSDRLPRLACQTYAERRNFRRHQERLLEAVRKYEDIVTRLPPDPLDARIVELEREYLDVGRAREWFRRLEHLVVSVAREKPHEGDNESLVRMEQQDFVVAMSQPLPYFRLFRSLRDYCFDNALGRLIRQISFFESELIHQDRSGRTLEQRQGIFECFTEALDVVVKHEQVVARKRALRLAALDQAKRREQWKAFKEAYPLDDTTDAIQAFNALRPILRQCAEWNESLRGFQDSIQSKRRFRPRFRRSETEREEVAGFVADMVERVDKELESDIAFQMTARQLLDSEMQLDELEVAMEGIFDHAQEPDEIERIKRRFVEATAPSMKGLESPEP